MKSILCFGDSITYGESDAINGGWVSLLARHFQSKETTQTHLQTLVYNLGIASETTDGLKRRFQSEFQSRILTKETNIVVFSYGINDLVIHKNKNRVPLDYYINNLTYCIEMAKTTNALLIINNLLDFSAVYDGQINQHMQLRYLSDIKRYNQALSKIADRNSCFLNDLNGYFSEYENNSYLAKDGLHPNTKGHQLIFSGMIKLLESLKLS